MSRVVGVLCLQPAPPTPQVLPAPPSPPVAAPVIAPVAVAAAFAAAPVREYTTMRHCLSFFEFKMSIFF